MKIEEADKNITISADINLENTDFYLATDKPFEFFGCCQYGENNQLSYRLPPQIAEKFSPELTWLNKTHSGVRITFSTNSPFISFSVEANGFGRTVDDTLSGAAGIFVTASEEGMEQKYINRVSPSFADLYKEMSGEGARFSGNVKFDSAKKRDVIVWLPILTDYKKLYIGLEKNSDLGKFSGYRYKTPVVFYGSSITMGVGASSPLNTYPALISRTLNTDFVNLGFSGNALGESEIAEYIASLEMSAFVYDYDHNAPTVEHLSKTHEKFFKIIREKQPDLPVIILTRPNHPQQLDTAERFEVIFNTFLNAKTSGDNKVWFINGGNIFDGIYRECCTHENCHPNDLGYSKMADAVSALLKEHLR